VAKVARMCGNNRVAYRISVAKTSANVSIDINSISENNGLSAIMAWHGVISMWQKVALRSGSGNV